MVCGGLLAIWWPRAIWLHLPAAVWGVLIEFSGWMCPLTPLENALRQAEGRTAYQDDFVAHYILPVLYPEGLTRSAQMQLGVLTLVINVALYSFVFRRAGDERRKAAEP